MKTMDDTHAKKQINTGFESMKKLLAFLIILALIFLLILPGIFHAMHLDHEFDEFRSTAIEAINLHNTGQMDAALEYTQRNQHEIYEIFAETDNELNEDQEAILKTLLIESGMPEEEVVKRTIKDMLFHHLGDIPYYKLNLSTFEIHPVIGHGDTHEEGFVITIWSKHTYIMSIICGLMLIIFIPLGYMYKTRALERPTKFMGFFEAIIIFIRDEVVVPNFHERSPRWTPFFLTMFFFILFANLGGLLPNSATVTGNLAVTMSMAAITLLLIFGYGFVKKGLGFLKMWPHGLPAPLIPIMFVIELIGQFTKAFALMIRLFANMTGGHVVIIMLLYLIIMFDNYFIALASVPASVAMNMLEIFVCFLQAYIFTFLSSLFISMSAEEH